LDVVKADYKFLTDSQYKSFKQKIFTDFKKSIFAQLDGKEFKLGNPNFNQIVSAPLDLDEYLTPTEINALVNSRLIEAIDYNMSNVTYKEYPQSIKDIINQKKDLQVLQNLLDTTTITKSNLTQTEKLGKINKDVKITPNTPVPPVEVDPILRKVDPPVVEPPIKVIPTPDVISTPQQNVGGGYSGRRYVIDDLNNMRIDPGFTKEVEQEYLK
jgi:hypothetical protein